MDAKTALGSNYRLHESVGLGASGEVWRATDKRTGDTVAAKLLHPHLARDHDVLTRFVQERAVLTALDHPSVVAVRDLIVDDGRLAIVMDFLPTSLARELSQVGTMPPAAAVGIVVHVLAALAYAHDKQLVHRDVKPDNVLLTNEWGDLNPSDVQLSDFGIAGVIDVGGFSSTSGIGTPAYMAPELIRTGEASPASDVYAVGIMLYELLSGRTPFGNSGTPMAIGLRHLTEMPLPLDVPAELSDVLHRMLAKDQNNRPTANQAAAELRELLPTLKELPALEPMAEEQLRPGTILKDNPLKDLRVSRGKSPSVPDADLGPVGSTTILKPLREISIPEPTKPAPDAPRIGRTRMTALIAAAIAVVVAVVWAIVSTSHTQPQADASAPPTATQTDQVLPTGLTITRTAVYDSSANQVRLEVSYGAQNSPLTGPFVEVVPAFGDGGGCAAITWTDDAATHHRPSETGFSADCAWQVTPDPLAAQGSSTVTATVPVADSLTEQELSAWLASVSQATEALTTDTTIISTAYPVQRIKAIQLEAPTRVVSQVPLELTLVPVWPSGADALNPLYRSPSVGAPSSMLAAIAGPDGVRFADGCGGALRVSANGLTVSTVSISPSCRVNAHVGNFTMISSNEFAIVARAR